MRGEAINELIICSSVISKVKLNPFSWSVIVVTFVPLGNNTKYLSNTYSMNDGDSGRGVNALLYIKIVAPRGCKS